MDPSKLYVPDPQKWVKFYKNMAEGKTKPFLTNQIGGGSTSKSFITLIDKNISQSESQQSPTSQLPIKLVSSTQQAVDQAKQELKREGEDLKEVVTAMKVHRTKRRSPGKVVKRKKAFNKKIKKGSRKSSKRVTKKKARRGPRKQSSSYRDIFDR